MPSFWMITNRKIKDDGSGLGRDRGPLSFWVSAKPGLDNFVNWTPSTEQKFRTLLLAEAGKFPLLCDAEHEQQKHVTLFVHGYDNSWQDAARRYERLCGELFSGAESLGLCVLFSWPSDGMVTNYLPDRKDARESAQDFADVLTALYDLLTDRQAEALADPQKVCRAKTSIIAHSMGNFLLQKAMQVCWTRRNQPLLMSLINQLIMVAADVDNDLFRAGEQVDKSDGDAIANLTYRVTALYTGRDPVLGMSAGLKHFGKRRLGRSGLECDENGQKPKKPDNVWDVDCTPLFPSFVSGIKVHSIYFGERKILALMRDLLRGVDRGVLQSRGVAPR
jgi:esterase/lipase superfamily enzyme